MKIFRQLSSVSFLLFLFFSFAVQAQDKEKSIDMLSSSEIEHLLKMHGNNILHAATDSERVYANERFKILLQQALEDERFADFPFDSVATLSKLSPPDKAFRIFTWILPSTDGQNYKYLGFVLTHYKKEIKLIELSDKSEELIEPQFRKTNPANWYGALYYKIIPNKVDGKTLYTLLGWRGVNTKVTRKIIDNLSIKDGRVSFGNPAFRTERLVKNRVIMEYNANLYAMLRYTSDKEILKTAIPLQEYKTNSKTTEEAMRDVGKKTKEKAKTEKIVTYKKIKDGMIIFDHLSPASKAMEGQYQYYGPDFTYDGFVFEDGKWNLYSNLDLRTTTLPQGDLPKASPSAKMQKRSMIMSGGK